MRRKLTEAEKWQHKADRENARRAEGFPLFAEQDEKVTARELWERNRRQRGYGTEAVNHILAWEGLGVFEEESLRLLALKHVPREVWGQLVTYRVRVYPDSPSYGVSFWQGVLTGRKTVFHWQVVPDPSLLGGRRLIEDGAWPPEGWQPPYTIKQLRELFPREQPAATTEPGDDGGLAELVECVLRRCGQTARGRSRARCEEEK